MFSHSSLEVNPGAFITHSLFLPFIVMLVVCGSVLTASAQSATATLSGTIVDQNGAVVPGVNVTVTNKGTAAQRQATTNEEGYFTIPLLPPSTYMVNTRRDGFSPVEVRDVVLNVSDQKALLIQLKAGDVNATVVVDSSAELVRTDSAVATVVDRQFVSNIPLNGRSLQSLITLTPGVVLVSSPNNMTSGQFSISGQRANANYFTVDGVSANVGTGSPGVSGQGTSGSLPGLTADGATNSLVSIDALQEFKIQTSTYSAEFGRQPGGQISFVTRSGTNDFRGSVFEYLRNEAFDANDWFANRGGQRRPPERQHDFGGVFAGPLFLPRFGEGGPSLYNGQNKTFFFFSYEGLRLRLPRFALTNVPSLALRQAAPDVVRPVLNAFPLPNGRDLGNGLAEFASVYADPSGLNATSVRIDQVIGRRFAFFGRVNKALSESALRQTGDLALQSALNLDVLTVTVGANFIVSSQMSNELRANYTNNKGVRFNTLDNFGGSAPFARSVLMPALFDSPTAQTSLFLFFPGVSPTPSLTTGTTGRSTQRQLNLVDNFALTTGSHQLKFGIDYRRLMPIVEPRTYFLNVRFTSQAQVINSQLASGSVTANVPFKAIYTNFSAFAQDTWRLSRRLTLSLGLRWEFNPPPGEADGKTTLSVRGLENPRTADLAPLGTPLWKTAYNNFAPRVGAAYQLSEAPGRETVLRGGFGVFYDVGSDQGSAGFGGFPFSSFRNLTSISFPFNPAQIAPAPFPGLTPPYGTIQTFDPDLMQPYTLQGNLAVERSVGKRQSLSASYVGAVGRRLILFKGYNLSAINPKFSQVRIFSNGATSDYHSLQLQFQRRLSRGLQVLASYTWAHSIDEASSDLLNDPVVLARGNSDFDIRHNFASALTYDIPVPVMNRVAGVILRKWSIDSRINYQTAFPLNIFGDEVIDPLDGTVKQVRVNLIQGVPIYINDPSRPGGRVINRAAFSSPAAGINGSLGRNVVRGLPSWQLDMALRRQFRLTEKVNLQFRAEAFNLFNHPNFGAISTGLTNARFGEATNMLGRQLGGQNALYQIGGPRSFQFALKCIF